MVRADVLVPNTCRQRDCPLEEENRIHKRLHNMLDREIWVRPGMGCMHGLYL